ncbi:MAG TPA: GAF domain-containing protein [Pseudonocardia sp.]|uniref:GAF domain-containing sensor histidine kinase n=1 Tax=Pseudonocardia sp. TaxID=60912 RepID=UPI002C1EE61A|nr:GAF domain-containing protein [Pseudonocardia sp.]HTF51145.1 GAF domain-containing protein [Pseudonocardia sp.]
MNAPDTGADEGYVADANDPPDGTRLRALVDEQAALRRVATLVAGGARPAEVFSAVADELGRLIGAEATFVSRVDLSTAGGPGRLTAEPSGERGELDGYTTVLGSYGRVSGEVPVGFRVRLQPGMVTTEALQTGSPARVNGEKLAKGPFGVIVGKLGLRAAVATPIVVGGRYWGVTVAATSREDFPAATESRMADFMELAALAIANANAEQELRELADTQAALRRLAMLVARGEPPEAMFAAVTREALRHFGSGTARMIRYELDGTATLLANEGTTGPHVRVGERWEGYPATGLTATVFRTGQAARVEDYRDIPGGEPYLREGLRSAVAMPIHVEGRLWGAIAVGSGEGPLPPDTEQRMTQFTDLVATAVANAQNRAELIASRARIVAASDEARRRIERDLHDGAQQHLLALALRLRFAAAPEESDEIHTEITDVADGLMDVIDELQEISRGIHPAILSSAGLRAALRALGRRSVVPVQMDVRIGGRLPGPVEVGAYYVVSETLTNAAKHANASVVEVDAEASGGALRLRVQDDGVGGADPQQGSGLAGLKDRIEALSGTFSVHSPPGGGTTVSCELPVPARNRKPVD